MKFSNPPKDKPAGAFTLIELLTVIAIIAILMGLLFPVFSTVRESARKTQAKSDEANIVTAVKAYYTEYGKYPAPLSTGTSNAFYGAGTVSGITWTGNNSLLFDILRNNTAGSNSSTVTSFNPRQIVFMELPSVKNNTTPVSGVIPNGSTGPGNTTAGTYYDPWGSPYNVGIDAGYSNSITNPYGTTGPGGSPLSTGAIAFAYGRNGLLGGDTSSTSIPKGFTSEGGTPNVYTGSGDVISWQ
jgi:prepilin-type N-terminal cleavage/methylation domain-containing protein